MYATLQAKFRISFPWNKKIIFKIYNNSYNSLIILKKKRNWISNPQQKLQKINILCQKQYLLLESFNSQIYNVKFNKAATWHDNTHKDIVVGDRNNIKPNNMYKVP